MTYSSSPSELVSFGGRDFCYTCNLSLLTLSRIGLVDGWTDWLVICREKAGVTQDLSTDPTLVSLATLSSEIGSSAHTSNLTSLIARLIALHVIITSMFEVFSFFLTQRQHCKPFTHGVFTCTQCRVLSRPVKTDRNSNDFILCMYEVRDKLYGSGSQQKRCRVR